MTAAPTERSGAAQEAPADRAAPDRASSTSATTSARSRKTSSCRTAASTSASSSIADYHALTTGYETASEIGDDIREGVLDFLAVGIDPEQSTLYLQSLIPEVSRAVPAVHACSSRVAAAAAHPDAQGRRSAT